MATFQLSVFRPIPSVVALHDGDHVVNLFTVDVKQTLDWVRANADALALQALASGSDEGLDGLVGDRLGYDALMVLPC